MKKKLVMVFILLLVMSLVISCSSTEKSNEDDVNEEVESLEGKEIIVGRWGGNEAETAAFSKMLEEFTAETGIEVQERVYSDYNTEIQAELIGGTAPDVFYVDAYMAPFFISQEVLMPIDKEDFELEKFYEPLREAFNRDGEYYAVSKDYSTLALYYNKSMLSKEDIPKTLEEIWGSDFLINLKKSLPEGTEAMTYNLDLARNMYIAENGGYSITDEDMSNIASQEIIENLTPQLKAAQEGKLVEPKDLGFGWNGDIFGNEKSAIMIEGNWVLGHLQQNFPEVDFGVMEIPTYNGEKGSMVFTVGYGINASTNKLQASKAFVKFATGVKGMTTWTTGAGVLPSRKDVTVSTDVISDALKAPHIAAASYASPWQKGLFIDTINQEFKNYAPSIIKMERGIKEGLKLAEDEANKIIEENR